MARVARWRGQLPAPGDVYICAQAARRLAWRRHGNRSCTALAAVGFAERTVLCTESVRILCDADARKKYKANICLSVIDFATRFFIPKRRPGDGRV